MLAIQLPREIESALLADAAAHGVAPEAMAGEVLAQRYGALGTTQSTVEVPRTLKAFGKFAHLNVSSEGVHQMRREEVERDEAKYAARHPQPDGGNGGGA